MAQRPKLNRVWSSLNHALRRDPGDEKYLQGWISEIPTFQVLNYLQYKSDIALLSLAERGIFEWGDDVQYQLGSVTWDEADRHIYVAVVNKPSKTKRPSMNPDHWSQSAIQVTRLEYDTVVAAINKHIADVTGNPHRLTAGRLNAYNKDEIDIILEQYRVLVANHAKDTNNPHKTKAVDIGAVAVTGGTYTGDVIFASQSIYLDSRKVSYITSKNNGIWQVRGEYAVGVGEDGVARTGKFGALKKIITEEEFVDYKYQNSAKYAVPVPAFQKLYVRDMNIQFGADSSDGNMTPDFSNPYARITSGNIELGDRCSPCPINGQSEFTIALDIVVDNKTQADANAAFWVQFHHWALQFLNNNKVRWLGFNAGRVDYQLQSHTWYTIVGVSAKDKLSLYVNGALVGTAISNNGAIVSSHIGLNTSETTVPRSWAFKNLRAWGVPLTAEQVSTI